MLGTSRHTDAVNINSTEATVKCKLKKSESRTYSMILDATVSAILALTL
jgi:hypothetical protein